jgi:hypothetical protein
MTSVHIHQNETIFPEAQKFKPERWLEKRPEGSPPLDRYLVSFTKGSRQCVGMQYVPSDLSHCCVYWLLLVLQRLSYDWQLQLLLDDLIGKNCSRPPELMLTLNTISFYPRLLLIARVCTLFSDNSFMTHTYNIYNEAIRADHPKDKHPLNNECLLLLMINVEGII